MIQTTMNCGTCGSTTLRKNGHSKSKAKYLCTACRHQAAFTPAAPRKTAQYAQVEKLLLERISQRAIVRDGRGTHDGGQAGKKSPLGSADA